MLLDYIVKQTEHRAFTPLPLELSILLSKVKLSKEPFLTACLTETSKKRTKTAKSWGPYVWWVIWDWIRMLISRLVSDLLHTVMHARAHLSNKHALVCNFRRKMHRRAPEKVTTVTSQRNQLIMWTRQAVLLEHTSRLCVITRLGVATSNLKHPSALFVDSNWWLIRHSEGSKSASFSWG